MSQAPFRYATVSRCLARNLGDEVLRWLSDAAPWGLKKTDFYEQYEFSCWDSAEPVAAFLTSPSVLDVVRSSMTEIFGYQFEETIGVVCHKLLRGQRIGIHNDYLVGQETHRLVVQLNRGLADEDGGILMLFNSADPVDIHQMLRPAHLSGLAFEISPDSFHAVSQMHRGARYTLIYSLRALAT